MTCSAPIAFNINFDSLAENYGFPKDFSDPSFLGVCDRIMNLAQRYDVKLSLYVIGRDLENPETFARVREWAQEGHEVGNHSWSHPLDLGSLAPESIDEEIRRSHELILKCIGTPPVGFSAPGWSTSRGVVSALIDLDYVYDTSLFPSFYYYPMVAKVAFNCLRDPARCWKALYRSDYLYPFTCTIGPHFVDRHFRKVNATQRHHHLLILPLPTRNRFSPACWHTIGFIFGWEYAKNLVFWMLNHKDGFYYLLHPADFFGAEECDSSFNHFEERMNVSLSEKLRRAEEMFDLITTSSRPVVTMGELAEYYYRRTANITCFDSENKAQ